MTDRLALARAFEDAGIERTKAETVAGVVFDAIRENVATKEDVVSVRGELREAAITLRTEMRDAVHQLTLRGLFGAVSLFFALLGALHYWPPGAH